MRRCFILCALVCWSVLWADTVDPEYSGVSNRIFWFIQITDTHITTDGPWKSNFRRAVGEGVTVVHPAFIVNTGDVTDGSPGTAIWCTDGPRVEEWEAYHRMIDEAGMEYGFYFDIAGNHDAYEDPGLKNWIKNSVTGQAIGEAATFWTVYFSYGSYLFPDLMTSSNVGRDWFHDSDVKGFIIQEEADKLARIFEEHEDASVIFALGHHGLYQTKGYEELVEPLFEEYNIHYYLYGHAHDLNYRYQGDVAAWRTNTLGHGNKQNFTVFAFDNNIVSMTVVDIVDPWPLLVLTAPATAAFPNVKGKMVPNKYAPPVPQCEEAPVRVLAFDHNYIPSVRFKIDDDEWIEMDNSVYETALWMGYFDATRYEAGAHTLSIEANGRVEQKPITISDDECSIDPGNGDQPLETPIVVPGEDNPSDVSDEDVSGEMNDADVIPVDNETSDVDESSEISDSDTVVQEDDDGAAEADDDYQNDNEEDIPVKEDGGCSILVL